MSGAINPSPQLVTPPGSTYRETYPPLSVSAEVAKNTIGKNQPGTHSPKTLQERVKQLESEALQKDEEIKSLAKGMNEALANQTPFITVLQSRIEAQDLRIKTLDEELKKYQEDERDEDHLRQTIGALEEELVLVKASEMEYKNTATELKEHNNTLEVQLKKIEPKLSQVFRPTSNDLSKILEDLKPIINEVKMLSGRINNLREEAQKTCEMISDQTATATILEKSLQENDPKYDELIPMYLDLQPRIKEELKSLMGSIQKATHKPIPEEHLKAFSAKNYLSQKEILENDKAFEDLLKRCQETHDTLSVDLKHMDRRYGDVADHLNLIDKKLGLQKNSGTWSASMPFSGIFVEWKSKTRISPTNPYFVKEPVSETALV